LKIFLFILLLIYIKNREYFFIYIFVFFTNLLNLKNMNASNMNPSLPIYLQIKILITNLVNKKAYKTSKHDILQVKKLKNNILARPKNRQWGWKIYVHLPVRFNGFSKQRKTSLISEIKVFYGLNFGALLI